MRSPSVSISATSTPSSEVPLIKPTARSGRIGRSSVESDARPVTPPARPRGIAAPGLSAKRAHERLQIRAPARALDAGLYPPGLRAGGTRSVGAILHRHRLHRLRLHRAVAPRRLAGANHDALLDAADRASADRPDGRRD